MTRTLVNLSLARLGGTGLGMEEASLPKPPPCLAEEEGVEAARRGGAAASNLRIQGAALGPTHLTRCASGPGRVPSLRVSPITVTQLQQGLGRAEGADYQGGEARGTREAWPFLGAARAGIRIVMLAQRRRLPDLHNGNGNLKAGHREARAHLEQGDALHELSPFALVLGLLSEPKEDL